MMKFLRKLKAKLMGTFVTSCPNCHKHFYGNELYHTSVKLDKYYRYVCDECVKEHNKKVR